MQIDTRENELKKQSWQWRNQSYTKKKSKLNQTFLYMKLIKKWTYWGFWAESWQPSVFSSLVSLEFFFEFYSVTHPGRLGDRYTGLGAQTLAPKKHILGFLFSVVFQLKKYVEVVLSDFTMHLIISKWLRRQKWGQKWEKMKSKDVEAKEETGHERSVFIHLNT